MPPAALGDGAEVRLVQLEHGDTQAAASELRLAEVLAQVLRGEPPGIVAVYEEMITP
jgi:hypothetical protein